MTLPVGILVSGQGTNLQAILDDPSHKSLFQVVLVISNKTNAPALQRAEKGGIPTAVLPHQDYGQRGDFEHALHERLKAARVELVVLAGFMRVLGKNFVDRWRGRIMNIHPALLPSFPGVNAIEQAYRHGVQVTGVTVHFVEEKVDGGPIILQEPVRIESGETLERLEGRIHQVEHRLYPQAIRLFAEGRLRIEGRKVVIGERPR